MQSRVKESEISYEERNILAKLYTSFFLVLGLFLFMSAIMLYIVDWFGIAMVLFLASGVGIVIYKIRENVILYPHYKEVAFHYVLWVGIPMTAVVILMAILFYYGQIAVAYLLSILLLFIPLILYYIVIKEYPIFPHEAKINMILVILVFGILLFTGGSLFSLLIIELVFILALLMYISKVFDLHVLSRSYKMMSKAQKKHLFALFIFWFLLLFLIVLPILFIKDRTLYELWWLVIYLPLLAYDIWYLKKRREVS